MPPTSATISVPPPAEQRGKPLELPEATRFSKHPTPPGLLSDVNLLKAQPELCAQFIAATTVKHDSGRPRMRGDWGLVMVAFVNSGWVKVSSFWANADLATWQACGFATRPSKSTTYARLAELECSTDGIAAVTDGMVKIGVEQSNGHVGHDVCIDGTQAETPAALRHCCPAGTCPSGAHHALSRASTDAMINERHALADLPEEQLDLADVTPEDVDLDGAYPRWKINGHWYELLDVTAGIRWYRERRLFWAGFYIIAITDQYTGAILHLHVTSASTQESKSYEPAMERLREITGKHPRSVTGDRGFSTKKIFAYNTERGIYSVIPLRADVKTGDQAEWDAAGAPRCESCGTRTEFVRHERRSRGKHRNQYRCPNGCGDHVRADGTITPRTVGVTYVNDPRLHIPLPRTHPLYEVLNAGRSIFENTHREDRERYLVATHGEQKLRRKGIGWQILRCEIARLTEWVRILTFEGWFENTPRQNTTAPRERVIHRHRRSGSPPRTGGRQGPPQGRGRRRTTAHQRQLAAQASRGAPRRNSAPPTTPAA